MNFRRGVSALTVWSALVGLTGTLNAQTAPPAGSTSSAPPHRIILGLRRPAAGAVTPISGGIIGNKKTHVYHLAGEKGTLPAEKNRVYFRSEAEAQAAGFHAAGHRQARPSAHGLSGRMAPGGAMGGMAPRPGTTPPLKH